MFTMLKRLFAPEPNEQSLSLTNDSVRLDLPVSGWSHFKRAPTDRIESFRKGRKVLNINLQKYKRSDREPPTDEMVRDAVTTLSRETPTEIFKARSQWISHYKSGERGCDVDNWHMAALSPRSELIVATLIVMFTDDQTRTEMRNALSEASLTNVYGDS